MDIGPKWAQNQ